MPLVDPKSYRFRQSAHWAACARDGFLIDGDRLTLTPARTERSVSAAIQDRGVLALAYDPSGRLFWLRASGELVSLNDGHLTVEGRLAPGSLSSTEPQSVYLAIGQSFAWLAMGDCLLTFERLYWQQLGEQTIDRPIALGSNGAGAWCLTDGAPKNRRWIHVGPSGASEQPDVPLPAEKDMAPLSGAVDPSSGHLLTLFKDSVWRADPCTGRWSLMIDLSPYRCRFEPTRIAADCHGTLHLLDREEGHLWRFASDGTRIAERKVRPGTNLIASADAIALAGQAGIIELIAASETGAEPAADEERQAVLLTPTLISPREQGATWHRLHLEADLPLGTALHLRFAVSDDDGLATRIAEISARTGLSATDRLNAIEGLLPWDEDLETTLARTDDPLDTGAYDVPLDGIEATYLWIALHLHVPPTSQSATVRALTVRYPALSWIEDLPAIYRADPAQAAPLRRFLAVLEATFDHLETAIEALPTRWDVASVSDHAKLDFLLRWIGLPLPSDLAFERKHVFLTEAASLLKRRGTPEALQNALRIVTGQMVRVTDRAGEPLPWVVGSKEAVLGEGTLLIRRSRRGFALGGTARLGHDGLGVKDVPATDDLVRRVRKILIEIDTVQPLDDPTLAAIDAILDHISCRQLVAMSSALDPFAIQERDDASGAMPAWSTSAATRSAKAPPLDVSCLLANRRRDFASTTGRRSMVGINCCDFERGIVGYE